MHVVKVFYYILTKGHGQSWMYKWLMLLSGQAFHAWVAVWLAWSALLCSDALSEACHARRMQKAKMVGMKCQRLYIGFNLKTITGFQVINEIKIQRSAVARCVPCRVQGLSVSMRLSVLSSPAPGPGSSTLPPPVAPRAPC